MTNRPQLPYALGPMDDAQIPGSTERPPSRWLHWQIGPARTLLLATIVLLLVFLAVPKLDLWFSRQFYADGIGFPATLIPALEWLRGFAETLLWAVIVVLIASVVIKLIWPDRPTPIAPSKSLFLFSTLVLGPGLLVNVILKNVWGRPRPIAIEEFGGDLPFVGIWPISGYCDTNCSFVSGEASSAIWLIAIALVVPPAWRSRVAIIALVLAIIFSLNRIAFGGHFLSDVLLSWTLTLVIIVAVHHFLFVRPIPALGPERLEAALTRAGHLLRRGIGMRRDKAAPTDGPMNG